MPFEKKRDEERLDARLPLRLTKDQRNKLSIAAAGQHRTATQYARLAIQEKIDRDYPPQFCQNTGGTMWE